MKFNIPALILAIFLSSCSIFDESGENCPEGNGDENISISFSMLTAGLRTGSRTDDAGHEEIGSELQDLEDGIDMKDCAMFVFAKVEGSSNDEALLLKKINLGNPNEYEENIIGAPGAYTVNMVIPKTKLHELLGIELKPDNTSKILFRILLLTNCSSPGTSATAKWNQINGTTYSAVVGQLNDWGYAMNYIYNESYSGDDAIGIYSNKKKNVPMVGNIIVPVSQKDLYYSRPDNIVHLGELYLLRSIAKVRVVDNISNKDAEGYPKIVDVRIETSNNMARQMPFDAVNYQNGQQVHKPNIHTLQNEPDNIEPQLQNPHSFRLGKINDQHNMTAPADRKGDTFIGYIPEQNIYSYSLNGEEITLPRYKITVRLKKLNEGGTAYDKDDDGNIALEDVEYTVPMPLSQKYILRNHIYTLSVDRVARDMPAEVKWYVEEWQKNNISLDYSTNLSVTDPILDTESCAAVHSNGELVMKPWTATGSDPLKLSFVLTSPVGISWKAFLMSTEGAPNAFAFYKTDNVGQLVTDENNNPVIVPSVSGIIDGHSRSFINIVSVNPAPETTNYAKLQVVVTLADGSVVEVNVVDVKKCPGVENYTVVQSTLN